MLFFSLYRAKKKMKNENNNQVWKFFQKFDDKRKGLVNKNTFIRKYSGDFLARLIFPHYQKIYLVDSKK